ncbi:MAG: hypothetical protein IKD55_07660 [Sediminibacterium sp.]|nr:hypothetical protein [Sediminibacterium sp.]
MEVHHHTHHPKKWKEYFWEFFMLFLAVFCGFLAEYQLEHKIERDRAKEYIESLYADIKADQEVIAAHIAFTKSKVEILDSLIQLVYKEPNLKDSTKKLYYLARIAPRLTTLAYNTRTIEQLKNSGNFRLIKKLETSNKIMGYYLKFQALLMLETIRQSEQIEYQKIAAKIFDPNVFLQNEGQDNEVLMGANNSPLHSNNLDLLKELSVNAVYIRGTCKGIIAAEKEIKKNGEALLEYLKKEYHLE